MKCSCCGKAKRLFESFEELDANVNVCVECSKKLYKYQDSKHDKNKEEAVMILEELKGGCNSPEFTKWLKAFVLRLESKEVVQ